MYVCVCKCMCVACINIVMSEQVGVGVVGRQGKARHPVRRSNSSPEMSGEWRAPALAPGPAPAPAHPPPSPPPPLHVDDMILLPSCDPQYVPCYTYIVHILVDSTPLTILYGFTPHVCDYITFMTT